MNRLEHVRQVVDRMLQEQTDNEERRCGFVHLYGVAAAASLLALRRGLDPELAAIAGMLHDISSYQSGDSTDHARRSATEAARLLAGTGAFTEEEISTVRRAIELHSQKAEKHSPYEELLKDADVLQHHLYNAALPTPEAHKDRLTRVLRELSLTLSRLSA